jgi:hypothetical protein
MRQPDISQAKDPDLRASMAALLRAGTLARKAAADTDTDLVVVRDGRLVLVQFKTSQKGPPIEDAPAE